jgi:crotonobetainyl-CoA hydratase
MSDGILAVKNAAILEITIDRPKANAIDLAASRRLNDVVTAFRDDPELRVAIVTGAGDRFFSPGWDLKAATAGEQSDSDWGVGGFAGFNYPRNLNKPIIAAVNGIACGGGFEIVLGTDIIVMEEHAKFALPEINVGVLADAGTIKLRRRIPYHVAVEFLLTGRWMDAAEAKHWGLANHVVPTGQGLPKAREIARQLATAPPCCFRRSNSCCGTLKWCPSTKRSNCTIRWTRCSASYAPRISRRARGRSPRSASRVGAGASGCRAASCSKVASRSRDSARAPRRSYSSRDRSIPARCSEIPYRRGRAAAPVPSRSRTPAPYSHRHPRSIARRCNTVDCGSGRS